LTVHFVPETSSTNDWIRAHAATLADGDWVVAARQTAGRGRQGRAWATPPGNLAASCLLVAAPAERPLPLFSLVAALALHDCCAAHVAPARLLLKWPNDLLLDGAKLSGILLEAGDRGAVVLGIGVNLAVAPPLSDRPTAALDPGGGIDPRAFAGALATALDVRRAQWRRDGSAAIRVDWLARAHLPGTPMTVGATGEQGRFAGLGEDGALRLARADGQETLVHAGDILADFRVPA
jgi:BirA family biotin operon repressor/biotin-[acetyl-CoA-carboxylase] ligase